MTRLKRVAIDLEVHGVLERNRRSFGESSNDILRRLLLGKRPARAVVATALGTNPTAPAVRQRGLWTVELSGARLAAPNLKGAYARLLLELHAIDPTFLERFAAEKSRARRFVARQPDQLYVTSPALAKSFAQRLNDEWFFDTNLSTAQVSRRIRIAARLCALLYGRDVRIFDNLREI